MRKPGAAPAAISAALRSPRLLTPVSEIVLLPRGNDGVGIVGAFGIESPPLLPLLLVRPDDPIAERIAPYRRVVLVLLGRDRDSTATLPLLRAAVAAPNWRPVAIGSNVEVYERSEAGE